MLDSGDIPAPVCGPASRRSGSAQFGVVITPHDPAVRHWSVATRTLVPGVINTYAGGGSGCTLQTDLLGDGCIPANAQLYDPAGVAFDPAGNLYIVDALNNLIRKVTASNGLINVVAGTGIPGDLGEAARRSARR